LLGLGPRSGRIGLQYLSSICPFRSLDLGKSLFAASNNLPRSQPPAAACVIVKPPRTVDEAATGDTRQRFFAILTAPPSAQEPPEGRVSFPLHTP
jgi:hypothetical protein